MNTEPARAPLVATSPEDAANTMVSEGSPIAPPEPQPHSKSLAACSSWSELRATVNKHPLCTLAVAFSAGFLAGICTSLD